MTEATEKLILISHALVTISASQRNRGDVGAANCFLTLNRILKLRFCFKLVFHQKVYLILREILTTVVTPNFHELACFVVLLR